MATSDLSFVSTQSFRNTLIARNLAPYNVPGVYSPQVNNLTYETVLSDLSVVDSPDNLIAGDPFAQQLYPLNQYGPSGGYSLEINYNRPPLPVQSNEGPYDPNDTKLDLVNEFYIDSAYILNTYGPVGGFDSIVTITDLQNSGQIHEPYWDSPSFEPSSYTPYQIIFDENPVGDNGPLSNDSFIAKIGAERLKFAFEERVAAEVYQNTIGAFDLDSLQDPFEASLIASGQQPFLPKDYKITVPENPILATLDLATRLASAYWPVSPIPGDYFNENTAYGNQTNQTSAALSATNQLTGGLLGPILNTTRNPSEIFLANSGGGQKSALFSNIDYNRYQPAYERGIVGAIGSLLAAATAAGPANTTGGYYVGSRNAEPSTINSPPNQVPVDQFGRQVQTPVYGPSELGILYEGNEGILRFGLQPKPSIQGTGLSGKFTWTSPLRNPESGLKATIGGGTGERDSDYNNGISTDFDSSRSTSITFKPGSILDNTQKLVQSADNLSGIQKLKHVGNAINQISKVFNDGYKEMTKGSQVISYKDVKTGQEVGTEYCRVFTKDTPYYSNNDLQKSDGIVNSGRRFSYSVLDNTYNLNIAPWRGENSTNIV